MLIKKGTILKLKYVTPDTELI